MGKALILICTDLESFDPDEDYREEPREVKFYFTMDDYKKYLNKFLKRQKAVQARKPVTLGQALHATLGTIVDINQKYRYWEA